MEDKDDTFFKELVKYHISGQLKVAPEHMIRFCLIWENLRIVFMKVLSLNIRNLTKRRKEPVCCAISYEFPSGL